MKEHTHPHTLAYAYTHTQIHTQTNTLARTYTNKHICRCAHTHTHHPPHHTHKQPDMYKHKTHLRFKMDDMGTLLPVQTQSEHTVTNK